MKNNILILVAVLFSFGANAQTQVNLHVHHKLGGQDFAFNKMASNDLSQNFQLTRMEYYLSKITIIHDGGLLTALPSSTLFLIGADKIFNENLGSFNVTNIEGIKFSIGVDMPDNQSDPTIWPAGHPLAPRLSPAKQMNWSWPAGYRFAAMEGFIGTNVNNRFEIHSLGNPYYYEQTVMVAGVSGTNGISININADIAQALKGVAIVDGANNGVTEHGSSATNIKMLQNFRDHVFSAGYPLSVKNNKATVNFTIYPNPNTGDVTINLAGNTAGATDIMVMDITGKLILNHTVTNKSIEHVAIANPGMYIVMLSKNGVQLGTSKLIVH